MHLKVFQQLKTLHKISRIFWLDGVEIFDVDLKINIAIGVDITPCLMEQIFRGIG